MTFVVDLGELSGVAKKNCDPFPVCDSGIDCQSTLSPQRCFTSFIASSESQSMTERPLGLPVGMPIFASGHVSHQPRIVVSSVVASLNPWRVRGCLPMLPHLGF